MKLKHTLGTHPTLHLLLRFLVKRPDRSGFTLLELLISMVISSIVVSGLLYFVVNILQTNQRDASRSDTQRDMQMAMDYIARDVREATYVYGVAQEPIKDGEGKIISLGPKESCLEAYSDGDRSITGAAAVRGAGGKCTGLLSFLPASLRASDNIPVLAFWKPESLPSKIRGECKAGAKNVGDSSNTFRLLNATPCVAQRMYTLVVYSLSLEKSSVWRGNARIKRYQLPHFTESASLGGLTDGWAAPIAKDKRPLTWPVGDQTSADGTVIPNVPVPLSAPLDSSNDVLTDFVDDDKPGSPNTPYQEGYCPNGFDSPSGFAKSAINPKFKKSFYVCVRSRPTTTDPNLPIAAQAIASAGQGINPEVHIVIRGNAAGRGGIPQFTGEVPFQMETRVLSRVVYGKLSN